MKILLVAGLFALTLSVRAQLAEKGALLLEENFQRYATYPKERQPLGGGWVVRSAHGEWQRTAEGVQSTWREGHQPVLVVEGNVGDCVIEVQFRYHAEPGKFATCRLSATNPVLNPRAYAVSTWANVDFTSRALGLVLEHDEWSPGPITQVSRKMMEFKPEVWHNLRLEVIGNTALAACDGTSTHGSFEKFGVPKSSIWIATGKSPHELRNLRVYAARPNPGWSSEKAVALPTAAK